MIEDVPKHRAPRGKSISLEDFSLKYDLEAGEAERIYRISGPSEHNLDLLMAAKGIKPKSSRGTEQ